VADDTKTTPKDEPKRKGSGEPAADPRLDNRTGDQRPDLDAPLKPQQIHGGYPGDETEYEDPPSGSPTTVFRSEGPHGRGPQSGPSSED
jgi:hypothetical protein